MLTGRLFWKILIGCLLTYTVCSFGVLPAFSLLRHPPSLTDAQISDRLGPLAVSICRDGVVRGGPAACREAVAPLLAPPDVGRLAIVPADPVRAALTGADAALAKAPDGRYYRIRYLRPSSAAWPLPVPLEVLLLGLVGSLAFSAVLGAYVVTPIQRLRGGFDEMTKGNLTARVAERLGQRRDEIADLARYFDVMAANLEQLVTARDRLLHDVSHELRSPLGRLHLSIALARQDGKRLTASLDRIEHEASRLDRLVSDLLVLSRAESGVRHDAEYFDVGDLLAEIVGDLDLEAGSKGIEIRTSMTRDTNSATFVHRGNSELIRRAVENVVRNSVKFSPAGSAVDLCLAADAEWIHVTVDDQGPGVDEGMLPRVFDPFVTSGVAPASVGLGLSIAQRAVQADGGRIEGWNRPTGGFRIAISLRRIHRPAVHG